MLLQGVIHLKDSFIHVFETFNIYMVLENYSKSVLCVGILCTSISIKAMESPNGKVNANDHIFAADFGKSGYFLYSKV